jgi:cytosine/adenosine deaminase-related metal-dependent hydrolase
MINATALNMQPVHNPVSTVVMQASLANIHSVMVGGEWKKRSGKLIGNDLAGKLKLLGESGVRILSAMGLAAGAHAD